MVKCDSYLEDLYSFTIFKRVNHKNVYRVKNTTEFNLLTPNVNYSGRTAPLTSKVAFYVCIQQI